MMQRTSPVQPRKIAVIDIGTNSVLLLIGEKAPSGALISLFQYAETTRLGKQTAHSGTIGDSELKATIGCLKKILTLCEMYQPSEIHAVGTQVFRMSRNHKDVLTAVRDATGLNVRILSEGEEAGFSFQGAMSGRKTAEALVIDIGGGSTEIIHGTRQGISAWSSISLGALVLTEQYLKTDPPDRKSIHALTSGFKSHLASAWRTRLKSRIPLICTGGTATTLAACRLKLTTYETDQVDGFVMSRQDIDDLLDQWIRVDLETRRIMIPIDPGRADIIIAGTLILRSLMEIAGRNEVMVSDRGLRYGLACQLLQNTSSLTS